MHSRSIFVTLAIVAAVQTLPVPRPASSDSPVDDPANNLSESIIDSISNLLGYPNPPATPTSSNGNDNNDDNLSSNYLPCDFETHFCLGRCVGKCLSGSQAECSNCTSSCYEKNNHCSTQSQPSPTPSSTPAPTLELSQHTPKPNTIITTSLRNLQETPSNSSIPSNPANLNALQVNRQLPTYTIRHNLRLRATNPNQAMARPKLETFLSRWHTLLGLPRQAPISWHRARLHEELAEARSAKTALERLSETSDVFFAISRARHDGFPLDEAQFQLPRLNCFHHAAVYGYMLAKYSSRCAFYRALAFLCGAPSDARVREVVNPGKDEKLKGVALRHRIDPLRFVRVGRWLRRVWLLPP
ncbi:hypothetical protein F5Y16DRAFT_402072 [Xylariaceae sp. FL0255]|nr:hypothetical protein F5Y16DRAFT_402072 [Xylariaceae sp. FL0255]